MNIFFLDIEPSVSAKCHVDKHVVKMVLESCQLLCTAHRVLDGTEELLPSPKTGKLRKFYTLKDSLKNQKLYSATHKNHPSSVWVRESHENYQWLYNLFLSLLAEYQFRYGKVHKCSEFVEILNEFPKNIPICPMTQPKLAMPDTYKQQNFVESYREYYRQDKRNMAVWSKRKTPEWWY